MNVDRVNEKISAKDYSDEVHLERSSTARWFFFTAGTLFMVLGLIGVFLPLLPTTPFLLLAAACYARSSVRFYNWLMNHRLLGPYLRTWRVERRIPAAAKVIAVTMIVLTIGTSVWLVIPVIYAKVVVALIGAAVIVYIMSFPS